MHLPQRFVKLWGGPEANHPGTSNHVVRFRSTSPLKNLPLSIARKRVEANFLCISFASFKISQH
jgi:hypothetical protein